jgi:MerR family copper efflux transcriptional regulator
MSTYTIGQIAERTGFSTSALRFYERHGLLTPAGRSDAGYRLYDEQSLARLRFIDRAKQLGCTLEEVADLAELWEADDCGPVQARLHELVTARIADAQRRSTDLVAFTAQLQTAAAHLGGDPTDGPCDAACACVTDPADAARGEPIAVVMGQRADPAIACTLPAGEIPDRIDDWQTVLDHVIHREQAPDGGLRLTFDAEVPVEQLARLAVAEQGCCSFFVFAITVDQRGVALEVRAPDGAVDLVTAVFGAPPWAGAAPHLDADDQPPVAGGAPSSSSASRARARRSMSSMIGRTSSIALPAGSVRSQSR